jgi:Family of unknown function (DUF6624)
MTRTLRRHHDRAGLTLFAILGFAVLIQGCAKVPLPAKLAAIQPHPIPSTPDALAGELAIMVEADQEARFATMEPSGGMPKFALFRKLYAIDHANTERMKRIVDRFGWPTISKFGKESAHRAWLLVQHADAQPDFQRRCLDLMKPLLEKDEVLKENYAYLKDRVLLAEGKKQIYGTQFHTVGGVFQPRPLIDPDNVDKRRAEMGMVSIEEYKTWFEDE